MMNILRSIVAVLAGSITIALTAFGADLLMRQITPGIFATGGRDGNPLMLVFILTYSIVFSAFGGYVTAWLANRAPMKHVIALGTLQTIGALAAGLSAGDALPRWYAAAVVLSALPIICLGGYLRARK